MYASIISGFTVPLKPEHTLFFDSIIVPLHKVQICDTFYEQLLRCSLIFLSKDATLAVPLLEGLLKFWPFANKEKEPLFLTEIQEVLEYIDIKAIEPLVPNLFNRIAKCIDGFYMKVADKAMYLFQNADFKKILTEYKSVAFPIMAPVLNKLVDNEYNKEDWITIEKQSGLKNSFCPPTKEGDDVDESEEYVPQP